MAHRSKPFLLSALLLITHSIVFSQLLDTSSAHNYNPTDIQIQQMEDMAFLKNPETDLDTSLNLFYNYYPVYQNAFPFIDLGL